MKRDTKILAAIALLVIVVIFIFTPAGILVLHLIGYRAGMQGLDVSWGSVNYKNYMYDRTHYGPNPNYDDHYASAHSFVEPLDFDPDWDVTGLPNIAGSMGYVTVDRDVGSVPYGPWMVQVDEDNDGEFDFEWVDRKNETHTWKEKRYIWKEFEIKRFKCDWQINLWLTGTAREAKPDGYSRHYMGAEVWMRVTPQSFCYFLDSADRTYFAPALFQVVDVTYLYAGTEDPEVAEEQDIHPEAIGENFYIYYNREGEPIDLESEILSYQGARLDPLIFRDEYWIKFHIYDIAAEAWWVLYGQSWDYRYPSWNFKVLVYVFVVGEWTVKLFSGEVKDLEPHKTGGGESFWDYFNNWWENVLGSPYTWIIFLIIMLFVGIIIFVVLAIFAPSFLLVLLGRKKDKGGG